MAETVEQLILFVSNFSSWNVIVFIDLFVYVLIYIVFWGLGHVICRPCKLLCTDVVTLRRVNFRTSPQRYVFALTTLHTWG